MYFVRSKCNFLFVLLIDSVELFYWLLVVVVGKILLVMV